MKGILKRYFIPHHSNNFQPHFWKGMSFRLLILFVFVSFGATFYAAQFAKQSGLSAQVIPSVLVDLTNQERKLNNVGALTVNQKLIDAAKQKAQDMFTNQYFAHNSPSGVSPWSWFDKVGYDFLSAGENLAIHYTDSTGVQTAWLNSPGHRANIVNGKYTEIGIAAVEGVYQGYPTTIVVEMFGKPAIFFPTAVPSNTSTATTSLGNPNTGVTQVVVKNQEPKEIKGVSTEKEVKPTQQKTISKTKNTSTETAKRVPIDTDIIVVSQNEKTIEAVNIKPGLIEKTEQESEKITQISPSLKDQLIINPSAVLKTLYSILAILIAIALSLLIFIEVKKQHIPSIVSGFSILLIMFGLYKFSVLLF